MARAFVHVVPRPLRRTRLRALLALVIGLAVAAGALLVGLGASSAAARPATVAIGLDGDLATQCDDLLTAPMRDGLAGWGQSLAGADRGAVAYLDREMPGLFCTSEALHFGLVPLTDEAMNAYATQLEANFWARDGEQYLMGGRMYADTAVLSDGMLFFTHRWYGENQVYTSGPTQTALELRDAYLALMGTSAGGADGAGTGGAAGGDAATDALTCTAFAPTGRLDHVTGGDITLTEGLPVVWLSSERPDVELEGLACTVLYEGCLDGCTDAFGYGEISDDVRAAFEERLISEGYAATPTDAGGVTYELENDYAGAIMANRFDDARWYYDYSDEPRVDEVRASLLEALEPPADDAEPAAVLDPDDDAFAADEPSVLSSLTTLQSAGMPPAATAATAALTLVFAALVGLPGLLIEQALSDASDRRAGTRRFAPARLWERIRASLDRAPAWLTVTAGIVVASAVATGVEPAAGFNEGTLRLFLSFAVTFVVDGLIGLLVAAAVLRRTGVSSRIGLRLASIAIVIVAVLATRLTGFEPGVVFGLILALQLAAPPSDEQEVVGTGAELGTTFGVGIVAWLGYSLAVGVAGDEPGMIALFLIEALGGITVGALAALPLVLLPLPSMPGRVIWRRSKAVWFGAFAIASAAFLVIVMRVPPAWEHVDMPLVVWSAMFAAYALIAVVIWGVLVARRRRAGGEGGEAARSVAGMGAAAGLGAGRAADPDALETRVPDSH